MRSELVGSMLKNLQHCFMKCMLLQLANALSQKIWLNFPCSFFENFSFLKANVFQHSFYNRYLKKLKICCQTFLCKESICIAFSDDHILDYTLESV